MERDQTNHRHSLARNFPPCRRRETRTKLAKNRPLQISGMGQDQASAPRVSISGFYILYIFTFFPPLMSFQWMWSYCGLLHNALSGSRSHFFFVNTCLSFPDVTSWRDGGGRLLAPTIAGEGVAEGGVGGAMGMEGAAGAPLLQNPTHGLPRNPPAGSPTLPLPQPVGPQFPPYRGILPPFVSSKNFTTLYHLGVKKPWCQICINFFFFL